MQVAVTRNDTCIFFQKIFEGKRVNTIFALRSGKDL